MEEKYYEILRHYVNPNDCAIVVKQILSLHTVSQQRELLQCFCKLANITHDTVNRDIEETIYRFNAL